MIRRFVVQTCVVLGWGLGCTAQGETAAPKGSAPTGVAMASSGPSTRDGSHPVDLAEPIEHAPEPDVPLATPTPSDELAPLSDEQRAIFFASPEDRVPEHRGGIAPSQHDKHYLSGNEKTLDAFYATLQAGTGGGYVGVGTDQGYLFLGWGRFELAWLVDYDPAIGQIHELYRLLLMHADTPQAFVALWSESGRAKVHALIDAAHDPARAKVLRYWYRNSRGRIHGRLVDQRRHLTRTGIPSYLDDQATYDRVRRMIEQGRVRPMLVDLLESKGLAGIAEGATALGVPIRTLYLSNAEQYWKRYPASYRQNIAALPYAEDAVVLRTLTAKDANDDYRYNVQPITNYLEWLSLPFIGNVYHIVHAGPAATAKGITLFETTGNPHDSPRARAYREKLASKAAAAR